MGEEVLPPEKIVQFYKVVLAELISHSQPIIADLTIIAGKHKEYGEGIADAICERILEVRVEQKLPSLFLLDSIVKNIGREYVRYFSSRLPEVFCETYKQVNPGSRSVMRHLFESWSSVFPLPVLRKIDSQLQFSSSPSDQQSSLRASESPQPTHGIHVNPTYLLQREHSANDVNIWQMSGISSNVMKYGQHASNRYDPDRPESTSSKAGVHGYNAVREYILKGYDRDRPESTSSKAGVHGYNAVRGLRHSPLGIVGNKQFPSSNPSSGMPSSSEIDDFAADSSPRRFSDGAYQSNPIFDSRLGRANGRGKSNEWQRKGNLDKNLVNLVSHSVNERDDHQSLRALIDAYGTDNDTQISYKKRLRVERLDMNGLGPQVATNSWKNEVVDEFDSEYMSPTIRSVATKAGSQKLSISAHERESNYSKQHQIPMGNDSAINDDKKSPLGSGWGSNIKLPGFQTEQGQILGMSYPQESRNTSQNFSHSSHFNNGKGRRKDFRIPMSASGVSSTGNEPPAGVWPNVNVHRPYPSPLVSTCSLANPTNASMSNQVHVRSSYTPDSQFPFNHAAPDQHNQLRINVLQSQFLSSQEVPSATAPVLLRPIPLPPLSHGYGSQGQTLSMHMVPSNPLRGVRPYLPIRSVPYSILPPRGAVFPSPPQLSSGSQAFTAAVADQPLGSAYSGVIGTLVGQGLISLDQHSQAQKCLGLEFNLELLKVRHESAIYALYGDLPRQCRTCGLRFKRQEEHSSHMDWHVTKNRMSNTRIQKPSRKWYVCNSMWFSGVEALGTESGPGFLPVETRVEKKDDEGLGVPADEDKSLCALCGESFDVFYSDETEEWMYKGAVYMNAPDKSISGLDKQQLGPIVHAKCM